MSLKVLVSLSCMKSPFCEGCRGWVSELFLYLWRGVGPVYGHLPGGMGHFQGAVGGWVWRSKGALSGRSPNKNSGRLDLTSSFKGSLGPRKHQSIAYSDWTLLWDLCLVFDTFSFPTLLCPVCALCSGGCYTRGAVMVLDVVFSDGIWDLLGGKLSHWWKFINTGMKIMKQLWPLGNQPLYFQDIPPRFLGHWRPMDCVCVIQSWFNFLKPLLNKPQKPSKSPWKFKILPADRTLGIYFWKWKWTILRDPSSLAQLSIRGGSH